MVANLPKWGPESFRNTGVLVRPHFITLTALLLLSCSVPAAWDGQKTFRFQSGFWINLHHFLFQHAVEQPPADMTGLSKLAPEHVQGWSTALGHYREQFAGKDLLERDMARIKNALGDAGNARSLNATGLDVGLVVALEMAAPVYRAVWWQAHDRSNRSRIDRLIPLIARHEGRLGVRLSEIYETEWPDTRIQTDVVFHANWAGAYTTLYPTRITISSEDAGEPPLESLEILFHEVSHALVDKVRAAISQRTRSLGKLLPRKSLWHAVLFYSTGEIVREGIPGYTPYALKHGLWERAWPDHLDVLEREWKPYLDGDRDFEAAIEALVDGLAVDP